MFHLVIRQDFRPEESLGFQTLQACLLPQSQFIPTLAQCCTSCLSKPTDIVLISWDFPGPWMLSLLQR